MALIQCHGMQSNEYPSVHPMQTNERTKSQLQKVQWVNDEEKRAMSHHINVSRFDECREQISRVHPAFLLCES